jgi:hypothetical protein
MRSMTSLVNTTSRRRRDPVPFHSYLLPIVRELPAQPPGPGIEPAW